MEYCSFNKETELIIAKNKLANNVLSYKILDNFIIINYLKPNGSKRGFKYSLSNVDIIINPKELSISDYSFVTKWNGKPLNNIKKIFLFKDKYYKAYTIIFENGTYKSYFDTELNIILSVANDKDVDLLKQYYKKLMQKLV